MPIGLAHRLARPARRGAQGRNPGLPAARRQNQVTAANRDNVPVAVERVLIFQASMRPRSR